MSKDLSNLINEAINAKTKGYQKYSEFKVGAALLSDRKNVFIGSNIENISFGLTICAERTAIFNAVLSGERNFKTIAIASDSEDFCPPCGACLQVMKEFCDDNFEVILIDGKQNTISYKLHQLLPVSFNSIHKGK